LTPLSGLMLTANSFIDVPSDAFTVLMHLSQVVLGLGMTLIRCFLDPHIILPGSLNLKSNLRLQNVEFVLICIVYPCEMNVRLDITHNL
jgi:hypothetical protein